MAASEPWDNARMCKALAQRWMADKGWMAELHVALNLARALHARGVSMDEIVRIATGGTDGE